MFLRPSNLGLAASAHNQAGHVSKLIAHTLCSAENRQRPIVDHSFAQTRAKGHQERPSNYLIAKNAKGHLCPSQTHSPSVILSMQPLKAFIIFSDVIN